MQQAFATDKRTPGTPEQTAEQRAFDRVSDTLGDTFGFTARKIWIIVHEAIQQAGMDLCLRQK